MGRPPLRFQPSSPRCSLSQLHGQLTDVTVQLKRYDQLQPTRAGSWVTISSACSQSITQQPGSSRRWDRHSAINLNTLFFFIYMQSVGLKCKFQTLKNGNRVERPDSCDLYIHTVHCVDCHVIFSWIWSYLTQTGFDLCSFLKARVQVVCCSVSHSISVSKFESAHRVEWDCWDQRARKETR